MLVDVKVIQHDLTLTKVDLDTVLMLTSDLSTTKTVIEAPRTVPSLRRTMSHILTSRSYLEACIQEMHQFILIRVDTCFGFNHLPFLPTVPPQHHYPKGSQSQGQEQSEASETLTKQ